LVAVWTAIRGALLPGGRLAGQLLGPRDTDVRDGRSRGHGRAEVEALLAGLAIERLDEEESDAVTPLGRAKRWHIWHLVARRPDLRGVAGRG
jgi:hypothetical protein